MNCSICKSMLDQIWLFCPFCGHKAGVVPQIQPQQMVLRAGSYGSGVRAQILELAVRQALSGGSGRETCASVMRSNNITAEEVEAEVRRRSVDFQPTQPTQLMV